MAKKPVSIRLSPEAIKLLRRHAKKMGLSQAGMIETVIRWYDALSRDSAPGSLREDKK